MASYLRADRVLQTATVTERSDTNDLRTPCQRQIITIGYCQIFSSACLNQTLENCQIFFPQANAKARAICWESYPYIFSQCQKLNLKIFFSLKLAMTIKRGHIYNIIIMKFLTRRYLLFGKKFPKFIKAKKKNISENDHKSKNHKKKKKKDKRDKLESR